MSRHESVAEKVERLELPFDELGLDKYGVSKKHLAIGFGLLEKLYRHYFRVKCFGVENIPPRGRAMLVGNHSGGIAIDGAMVLTSTLLEMNPPRLSQGMVEKFINRFPFASLWSSRTGQFTGLPEHAVQLLEDDRLLMVFPEGARGTAKLYTERYSLVDFGNGFMRLALKTKTPIVPFGFIGGGEAMPTIANLYGLGKLLGVPYVPLTAYGAAVAAAGADADPLREAAPVRGRRDRGRRGDRPLRRDGEAGGRRADRRRAHEAARGARGAAMKIVDPRDQRRHRARAGDLARVEGPPRRRARHAAPGPGHPKNVEVYPVDIRKRAAEDVFRKVRPDAVIHMATVSTFSTPGLER